MQGVVFGQSVGTEQHTVGVVSDVTSYASSGSVKLERICLNVRRYTAAGDARR